MSERLMAAYTPPSSDYPNQLVPFVNVYDIGERVRITVRQAGGDAASIVLSDAQYFEFMRDLLKAHHTRRRPGCVWPEEWVAVEDIAKAVLPNAQAAGEKP